ncbi:MAG: hypothetical protein ACYDAC_00340 [Candidatus Dormibacteria bacterium]
MDGTLGRPEDPRLPGIPAPWRVPALAFTVVICIAIFVTAVLIGLHG